jgi:hypothetical protein
MKTIAFRDVTPCSVDDKYQHFGGTCCPLLRNLACSVHGHSNFPQPLRTYQPTQTAYSPEYGNLSMRVVSTEVCNSGWSIAPGLRQTLPTARGTFYIHDVPGVCTTFVSSRSIVIVFTYSFISITFI